MSDPVKTLAFVLACLAFGWAISTGFTIHEDLRRIAIALEARP